MAPRDSILETEVEWLNSIKADLVVNFILIQALAFNFLNDIVETFDEYGYLVNPNRFQMLFQLHVVRQLTLVFGPFVSPILGNSYYCHFFLSFLQIMILILFYILISFK